MPIPFVRVSVRGLLLPCLLIVGGCRMKGSASTIDGGPLTSGMWVARLVPTGSSLGVRGDARLTPLRSGMRIQFDLRSITPRARHPWVIRTGRCGEANARDLSSRAGAVVEGTADGYAKLTATIDVQLEAGDDYHLVLAQSPSLPDTYIACGPLLPMG
jgi:hypothetical protein